MTSNAAHIINEMVSEAIARGSTPSSNQNRSGEIKVGPNTTAINQNPVRAGIKNGLLPITPRRPIASIHNATTAHAKLIIPKFLINLPVHAGRSTIYLTIEYTDQYITESKTHDCAIFTFSANYLSIISHSQIVQYTWSVYSQYTCKAPPDDAGLN